MAKKILIVDDELHTRKKLKKTLSQAGYQPVCAECAEEALDILEDAPLPVIFLELKLPGMNGIELCRRIKQAYPTSRVYALTGYSSAFERAECCDAGFDDYLVKPVDRTVFLDTARDAFITIENREENDR